ncbi:MAG TPA: hypothetical protein VG223_07270 [Solirubrobacteraceae bacterium]|jgi:hypothetical protein|nr:hypothetical protein [Solirubrobacteraceae bacterium]
MTFLEQLVDSLDARIAETNNEIEALQTALSALRDGATPAAPVTRAAAPRRPRRARPSTNGNAPSAAAPVTPAPVTPAPVAPVPSKPRAAKAPAKRPAAAALPKPPAGRKLVTLVADRLEEMLGVSDGGLSAISIAKQAGAGYNQVLALLRQLEQDGRVRRTGSRRTSLWRVVTDEERIADRAAELAARG